MLTKEVIVVRKVMAYYMVLTAVMACIYIF